jgi:hypothetical protein
VRVADWQPRAALPFASNRVRKMRREADSFGDAISELGVLERSRVPVY